MRNSDWAESTVLAEWAEQECRHYDLIASWETLLSVYETLGFIGPDNDDTRLSEFKSVITELNKFLTRMKNGLSKAKGIEAAVEFLASNQNTIEMVNIRTRPTVAYNKLKQQWISQSIAVLLNAVDDNTEEGESDE